MLNNAHYSYDAIQSRQHENSTFFKFFDKADDAVDRGSEWLADKFSGAAPFLSKCDYWYEAQIIPIGLYNFGKKLTGKAVEDFDFSDPVDVSDTKSLHDLFHDLDYKKIDIGNIPIIGQMIQGGARESINKGLQDVAGQLQDHVPSELITADFIKESIVSNDGFLHKWGLRIMGGGISVAVGAALGGGVLATAGGALVAGLVGMIVTSGFTAVRYKKDERKSAELAGNVARLNAETGHNPFTNVDTQDVLNELRDRSRHGRKFSEEELEGFRTYIDEANANHTGDFLGRDLGQESPGALRGYRFAMGLAAGFGGAKALEFLMDNDMFNGFGGASGQSAEAAGDVAGVIGGAAAGAAQNGATSVPGVVAAASAGGVSVQAVRNSLNAVLQSIGLDKNAILTQANQVGSLASAVRATAKGTNDESLQRAEQLLMQAREGLTQISNMLGQSQEQAHRYGQQL